ncbi:MAG: hypothetical protein ACO3JG_14590 [Luteolibacter sp.]
MKQQTKRLICLTVSVVAFSQAANAVLVSQYGILNLTANGGINPNTGVAWQTGDQYRLAFYTADSLQANDTDVGHYNGIVTAQAQLNSSLAGTTWRAMISTESVNVKDNTVTSDQKGS